MQVTIDGIDYLPVGEACPRIGVAVTTRNRPDVFAQSLQHHREHLPPNAVLVVVDDASDKPVAEADFRFDQRVGVARAKNKCLEMLDDAGVEHFFLFDDDTWPVSDNWWQPYIESPEPHLMYCFEWDGGPPVVATDGQHTAWAHPCGPMLYAHRSVLDAVGGMDAAYGTWGHEHVDWSNRIHNAHLTVWRFADVAGSGELLFCLDQIGTERSVSDDERRTQIEANTAYYLTQIDSAAFKPYRTRHNAVLTCWQHGPDRQRNGSKSKLTVAEATAVLRGSITGADLVALGDDDTADLQVPDLGVDLYTSRWMHYRRWLTEHPDLEWVWLVDANDVVMLNEPWDAMRPGILYIGYEDMVLQGEWMAEHHKASVLRDFMDANPGAQLLNCGVVGGDRATIVEYLTHLIRLFEQNAADRWRGTEEHDLGFDMGPMNYLARTRFADRLVWGSQVTTPFKSDTVNGWSWWKHK